MIDMARKQSSKVSPQQAPEPEPQPEPESRIRDGGNLNVWIEDNLFELFEKDRKRNKRTKTAHIEMILEGYFKQIGLIPK